MVEGENPYLYMGGLDQAMSVLVVKMNSEAVSGTLIKDKSGTTYALDRDVTTTGPIMLLTVDSTSEAATLQVLDKVLKVIPTNLKALQDQLAIPKTSRITSMNIASDVQAAAQNKNRIRMTLMVVAAGGTATVLLTGLLDRLLLSRKRRRKQRANKGNHSDDRGGNREEYMLLAGEAKRSVVGPKTVTDGAGHGLAPNRPQPRWFSRPAQAFLPPVPARRWRERSRSPGCSRSPRRCMAVRGPSILGTRRHRMPSLY